MTARILVAVAALLVGVLLCAVNPRGSWPRNLGAGLVGFAAAVRTRHAATSRGATESVPSVTVSGMRLLILLTQSAPRRVMPMLNDLPALLPGLTARVYRLNGLRDVDVHEWLCEAGLCPCGVDLGAELAELVDDVEALAAAA